MFVDEVKVHVRGGRGGNGVTAFERQPYEPRGRPDGGDGGHGGDVVLVASAGVASLIDYHHRPHRRGADGTHGQGDLRRGSDGDDEELAVPPGTVVRDADTGAAVADLLRPGNRAVVAAGGRGGRGNAAFRTSRRRAPRFHEFGAPGEERWIVLELKLVADVALVGWPNAGKSSVIARLSAARPKIAGYPFTTLQPNLGVVRAGDVDLVVADVPGLIPGASQGRGLGHDFLRHVERARVLVHVLDCASYEQRDPRADLASIVGELRAYQADLLDRPALVLLNKADADPDTAEIVRPDLEADGWEVVTGSAVTGEGMDRLTYRMGQLVAAARPAAGETPEDVAPPVLRPHEAGDDDLAVQAVEGGWRVTGTRVERWVMMLDLDNPHAVAYLQGRLARAGIEDELWRAGARHGDDVEIAGAVFEFQPDPGDRPEHEPGGSDGEDPPA